MTGNPKDILGVDLHPLAAMPSPEDARDYLWAEVGHGSAPFDWSVGFDDEKLFGFTEPTKNQGPSGSCGGQATGYMGGTFSVLQNKVFNEKSAKFIYAPIAYPNGGGTVGRDLVDRIVNTGWASEALCTSYDNGQAPSEAFMTRVQDISAAAIADAAKDKGLSYVSVAANIDAIAQALAANKSLFIGIKGSNNGTWLSSHPNAPDVNEPNSWGHWLKVGKARLNPTTGKKELGVHNSWGSAVGENGWQWIDEDYFKVSLSYHSNRPGAVIFEAWTINYNPTPIPTGFHHTFTTQMDFGAIGSEVQLLQTALQIDGSFPATVTPTTLYGTITRAAVQKFQIKYGITTVNGAGYGRVGPLTLTKLNQLFS